MKYKVIDGCISCGSCMSYAPDIFEFNDEGTSYVIKQPTNDFEVKQAELARKMCPVNVIVSE